MSNLKAIVGPAILADILSQFIPAKLPVMITGRPGIGKSEIVEQACAKAGADLIISHPVVSDPVDYKGLPYMDVDGIAKFVPFSELKALIDATKPTVFFLDDLGQASSAVQAAAMQLILARQINGHKVSDHVSFVAATNRREDKAGVSGILEPVKSRFAIFELEPSLTDWVDWALGKEWMPLQLINACRWKPQWITEWKPAARGAIENSPCPRNIAEVGKMMNLGLPRVAEFPAFSSRLGTGAATELKAFLDLYSTLPSINIIINDPSGAPIPNDPSAKYALIGALVGKADKDTFPALCTYVNRIPPEYSILFMKDISKKKPELQSSKAFIEWATKNQDLIL